MKKKQREIHLVVIFGDYYWIFSYFDEVFSWIACGGNQWEVGFQRTEIFIDRNGRQTESRRAGESPQNYRRPSIIDIPMPHSQQRSCRLVITIPALRFKNYFVLNYFGFRGWHGLMAYASQSAVVVIDTKNIQVVQCLSRSKHPIKKVHTNDTIILQFCFEIGTLFILMCLDFMEPFEGREQRFKSEPCCCWHQWLSNLLERERWQSYFICSGRQQIGCWFVDFKFSGYSTDFPISHSFICLQL